MKPKMALSLYRTMIMKGGEVLSIGIKFNGKVFNFVHSKSMFHKERSGGLLMENIWLVQKYKGIE